MMFPLLAGVVLLGVVFTFESFQPAPIGWLVGWLVAWLIGWLRDCVSACECAECMSA